MIVFRVVGNRASVMDGQIIAQGEHIVQVYAVVDLAAEVPGCINGNILGIIAIDLHPQLIARFATLEPIVSRPMTPMLLPWNLIAHKLLFAFFHAFG